jgi:hypothetical protein
MERTASTADRDRLVPLARPVPLGQTGQTERTERPARPAQLAPTASMELKALLDRLARPAPLERTD